MLRKVGTLVVGYVLRTVSLPPLDVGGVADRRAVALRIMTDNVIAHFFLVVGGWTDVLEYTFIS